MVTLRKLQVIFESCQLSEVIILHLPYPSAPLPPLSPHWHQNYGVANYLPPGLRCTTT